MAEALFFFGGCSNQHPAGHYGRSHTPRRARANGHELGGAAQRPRAAADGAPRASSRPRVTHGRSAAAAPFSLPCVRQPALESRTTILSGGPAGVIAAGAAAPLHPCPDTLAAIVRRDRLTSVWNWRPLSPGRHPALARRPLGPYILWGDRGARSRCGRSSNAVR
jgi:hypothetical protein